MLRGIHCLILVSLSKWHFCPLLHYNLDLFIEILYLENVIVESFKNGHLRNIFCIFYFDFSNWRYQAESSPLCIWMSPLYETNIFSIVIHLSPLYEILDVGERLVVELFGRRVQVDHLDPPPRVGRVPLHRRAVARLARPRRPQHQLRVPHLAIYSKLHHLFHMQGNVCKQCYEMTVARKFENGGW